MKETFSNPEEAKLHIKKLVPLGTIFGGSGRQTRKKIVGYTKYGNLEIGYRYVPTFRMLNYDGTLGRSKFELHPEDFGKHFKIRNNIPSFMNLR